MNTKVALFEALINVLAELMHHDTTYVANKLLENDIRNWDEFREAVVGRADSIFCATGAGQEPDFWP